MIKADVEGKGGFASLNFVDAAGAAGAGFGPFAPSEGSPIVWLLFFFFAMLKDTAIGSSIQKMRKGSIQLLFLSLPEPSPNLFHALGTSNRVNSFKERTDFVSNQLGFKADLHHCTE